MVKAPNFSLSSSQQAVLELHKQPEEYGQRLKKARAKRIHSAARSFILANISRNDRVADIGVGDGFVGRVLRERYHLDMVYGCDISEPNLVHGKSTRLYDHVWLATAHDFCRQMAKQATIFEWVTLISVVYYFSPEELAELLTLLLPITRKGVILTIDAIPRSMREHLAGQKSNPVVTYDHTGAWSPEKSGFDRVECVWHGTGWVSTTTRSPIPCELWALHKKPIPSTAVNY